MTSKGFSKQDLDQIPEFYVSVAVDEEPLVWMHPIEDPFVRQFVWISWLDRLKSLFRKEFKIEVSVSGNNAAVLNTMVARNYSRLQFSSIWNKGKGLDGGEQFAAGSDS